MQTIENLAQLCDFWSVEHPAGLNRSVYKNTACGASLSLYLTADEDSAIHNGSERWPELETTTEAHGFSIQTIVEGGNDIDGDIMPFPVAVSELEQWLEELEGLASAEWDRVNVDGEDRDDW